MRNSPKWLFDEEAAKPDRNRLEAYINSLGEGFLAFNDNGRIELCNSVAMELFDAHGLVGQDISVALKLSDKSGRPVDALAIAKSQSRGFVHQEYDFEKSNGVSEHLSISLSPIITQSNRFGGGFVMLVRPISVES